jgi:hypothetical protein
VEILPSARKHGISADDIRHAITNAVTAITSPSQPDFTMLIGADTAGRLLEVGVLDAEDNDYVIHAMAARPKYLRLLENRGGPMKTRKHPKDLTEDEADVIVQDFDDTPEDQLRTTGSRVLTELRAAAAARRDAEGRLEAAAIAARRAGLSWGVIGAHLGMTRQGARQRFDHLLNEDAQPPRVLGD